CWGNHAGRTIGLGPDEPVSDLSLWRRHRVHCRVLRIRQAGPHAGRRQGGDAAETGLVDWGALFRRGRDADGQEVGHYPEGRQAAGDELPTDMKKGRNLVVSTLLYPAWRV